MRQQSTDTIDKAVCTEDSGAARLEAVLVALVERKARALHAEQARRRARTHPLLLLLRSHVSDEEASIIGSSGERLPSHWCENEFEKKKKKLKLHTHHGRELNSPEQLELERRRRKRRRHAPPQKPKKHRTLLVSAIDEQAKVIHVLDPDELPRRARYTIMVTACLLLFLCLLLVGVTLRMAPLIDDMVRQENERLMHDVLQAGIANRTQLSGGLR
ncbi:uncharacterized protein LOC123867783 isoform X2 [Maniola jurtina]|uniref:uncharacterized protein LOC123867783 isoform X2 n=1 Tax=Maniola jurtina TaxID=191418 RepID=UPI001E68C7DD|nr:uncharacterized protein LOC123867783 isoform X2 [Maniola jurtina]XP_045766003.1 uncharacterized protein LOC123867783 isoform X2 [Maniola jurtina]XP_045766004.1 uncharacterized protein LOC123867783 isoform X2 [Maniola jurtina]